MKLPIDATTPPWVGVVRKSPSEFGDYCCYLRGFKHQRIIILLRGSRMRTFPAMFNEMSAALQFPWYFGHNLDALDECMQDLVWLPNKPTVVALDECADLLAEEPAANSELSARDFQIQSLCLYGKEIATPPVEDYDPTFYPRPLHFIVNLGPVNSNTVHLPKDEWVDLDAP